jgi:large conductance mechanosensitive channel
MAVGIIIGGAFGKIVSSMVNDVILPVVGKFVGGVDFSQLFVNLGDVHHATLAEATEAGAPVLAYGNFLQTVFDFLIIAFVIFMMVRAINKAKREEEAKKETAPPKPSDEVVLLREIRDRLGSGGAS